MICISGWAGTGKDECAGHLVKKYGAIHTGLADPGKRHLMDAYGFSVEQLWGPSKFRNAGDPRYPKPIVSKLGLTLDQNMGDNYYSTVISEDNSVEKIILFNEVGEEKLSNFMKEKEPSSTYKIGVMGTDPRYFLSPREGLQKYMELMNTLYADTWIRKGIDIHKQLVSVESSLLMKNAVRKKYSYSKENGVVPTDGTWEHIDSMFITCFSDFRHIHEHLLARKSEDEILVPVLIRIKRPNVTKPPFDHRSETEQTRIRDAAYDFILNNSGTLDDLYSSIDEIVRVCSNPNWRGLDWSPDFILPNIQEGYKP
jgi:hypothetical protein